MQEPTELKVTFLDIDGTINSQRSSHGTGKLPYRFVEEQRPYFDWIAVGLLRKLSTNDPSIKFVLSSAWRMDSKRTTFAVAKEAGEFLNLPMIDCTDTDGPDRGSEIQRWLDAHPEVTQYAIIDDDSDMLESQAPHFVQTHFMDGMRFCHFLALERILKGSLGGLYVRERFWENRDGECTIEAYEKSTIAGFINHGADLLPKPEKPKPMHGPAITIVKGAVSPAVIATMDSMTNEWFMQAARGECGWCCPDCCMSFPEGMPTQCGCAKMEGCDRLLCRDKLAANKNNADVDYGFKLMDVYGKANGTPTYTLQEGDSIDSICSGLNISKEDFEVWNGFQNGHSWPTPTDYVYIADPLKHPPKPKEKHRAPRKITLEEVRDIGEPESLLPGQSNQLPPQSKGE